MVKYIFLGYGIFLIAGCSLMFEETPDVLYGLPHVSIEMRESDFVDLRKNDFVNEYAAINIEIGGVKKTGRIRRRGDSSRRFPKPSFHVITEDGERHYIASNIDKSYCRKVFAFMIFKKYGFHVPEAHFVALSVNNKYQGLYISREHVDKKFFDRRGIGLNSHYEINLGGMFSFQDGHNSMTDFRKRYPEGSMIYDDLNILISALDNNDVNRIASVLNVENAAMYSLISSAIRNNDGIKKNIQICNIANGTGRGKFEIIPFDMDLTLLYPNASNYFPKYENGLMERAEEIFLDGDREQYVLDIMNDIRKIGIADGIVDSLRNVIFEAYKNDPYLQAENLDEHIAQFKHCI